MNDEIDIKNSEIYKEFNVENVSNVEALKQYSNAFGKTALYLIDRKDYEKTGTLSIFLLSHLSIELYLKSLLIPRGKSLQITHDLEKMLPIMPSNIVLDKNINDKILAINKIGINSFGFRYPADKKGDKYKNFKVELLPELNYSETFQEGEITITKGIKQSPIKNYTELIDDIKIVLNNLLT